jgi:F0F1-type ATP synthase beta subunit
METKLFSANLGAVASVRGRVVDARFDGALPPICTVLRAGAEGEIVLDVLVPLERVGKAGMFSSAGVGKTVLPTEMIHNLIGRQKGVRIFCGVGERLRLNADGN